MDATRVILGVGGVALLGLAGRLALSRRVRRRLEAPATGPGDSGAEPDVPLDRGRLATWLMRAGLRSPRAPARFVVAAALALIAGVVAAWLLGDERLTAPLVTLARDVPGGFAEGALLTMQLAPPIGFVLFASLPWLRVRSLRRQRVRRLEADLPVTLELMATLAEAGFGLDAALARVLEVQDPRRPLHQELRRFRQDLLAGDARLSALRGLAWRADVPSVSVLVGALVQAELVGAATADTLRSQAADLWVRRREDALTAAQSLPARLAFPMVTCFLPALFVLTLGPVLVDFLELADSVLAGSGR